MEDDENEFEVEVAAELPAGYHVMLDGTSLSCYATEADAEAFADAHPRNNGLEVSIEHVEG